LFPSHLPKNIGTESTTEDQPMGKKKRPGRPKVKKPAEGERTRVELRFDQEVYERIRSLAEQAGISVNQLMHGLARWATQHLVLGEPSRDELSRVCAKHVPGVLFLGRQWSEEERVINEDGDVEVEVDKGAIWGVLDFTERRVLREPD
jgi:hypothetical protein